jgi:hypothetical protein
LNSKKNVPQIGGALTVAEALGEWPSFHDAEIVLLRLERSASAVSIELAAPHVGKVVTFSMKQISDLSLSGEDVDGQNVISGLVVEKTAQGTRPVFHPSYGLTGHITAASVTVQLA